MNGPALFLRADAAAVAEPDYAAPFDALACIVEDAPGRMVFENTLAHDDPIFAGHYPHFAIFPGVLIFEAFSQGIACMTRRHGGAALRVMRIKSLRFLKSMHPGDCYRITLEAGAADAAGVVDFAARCECAGELVATAALTAGPQLTPGPRAAADLLVPAVAASPQDLMHLHAVLPQRYPMLLLDRSLALDEGRSVLAQKNISIGEPCYRFCRSLKQPLALAYPTSLLIESFSQAVGLLLGSVWDMASAKDSHAIAFGTFQDIVIHGHAYPGDRVVHHAELDYANASTAMFRGSSYVDGVAILTYKRLLGVMLPSAQLGAAQP
ncbi:hypothetical protein [Janthinobacterium fluminis]|uniref:ApeI dehydratase-like domain-containing protein n=1 Tax=Janthinobacterium fluminis TaxID=2987524 RepID=A0ABT5K2M9_9BURK|nr:hypothetical protein [Janthinobacterium fluminis]MDC8758940.1 hypothetical protein [Janthinobacterium fluminis]